MTSSFNMTSLDLTTLPSGARYEDTYGKWLDIFKQVAVKEITEVIRPPAAWVPLLKYMGARVIGCQTYFDHDYILSSIVFGLHLDRTAVEVLCGLRPETADALWKYDMEWSGYKVPNEKKREFIVTNNGSFHRPEVIDYLNELALYRSPFDHAVLVPCAADKPYPAELHKAVKAILPPHYGLYVATGVLGIVPEDLWPIAPYYDSGIPNQWRLFKIAGAFFRRNPHKKVICYTDFYSEALYHALTPIVPSLLFVDPPIERNGYLDLLDKDRLSRLTSLVYPKE
jgi:hypothetical protein